MPIYTFENTETEEQFTVDMSNSDREAFLKDNPKVIQVLTRLNIGDPVTLHVTKPPSDFQKYVLGKVKERNPLGSAVERRYTIPKEI